MPERQPTSNADFGLALPAIGRLLREAHATHGFEWEMKDAKYHASRCESHAVIASIEMKQGTVERVTEELEHCAARALMSLEMHLRAQGQRR